MKKLLTASTFTAMAAAAAVVIATGVDPMSALAVIKPLRKG